MARPLKQGLDYFSLDVDFLRDDKLRIIMKAQGTKSIAVIICLLSRIYKEHGYFLQWDERKMPYLVSDDVCTDSGVVTEVLSTALDVGFFDAAIFEKHKILTSKGIQKRYFAACSKRTNIEIFEEILLINPDVFQKNAVKKDVTTMSKNVFSEKTPVSDEKNLVFSEKTPESKGKESKGKESKVEKEKNIFSEKTPTTFSQFPDVFDFYKSNIHPNISEVEQNKIIAIAQKYGEELVIKAIERSVTRGKRNIGYIEGILKSWGKNGYDEDDSKVKSKENPQIAMAKQAMELLGGNYG